MRIGESPDTKWLGARKRRLIEGRSVRFRPIADLSGKRGSPPDWRLNQHDRLKRKARLQYAPQPVPYLDRENPLHTSGQHIARQFA